jgi:glycosyltransferase involved in cell wall biosynthesis
VRILWVGNAAFAPSGYGEQAGLFLPRFQQLGHHVAVLCNWGVAGAKLTLGGIDHYPSDGVWANRSLPTIAEHEHADIVIVLNDAWTMTPDSWGHGLPPVAIWAPIDHYPIPPAVLASLAHPAIRPIAMSKFGHKLMTHADLDPLYVPHGVDTNLFHPQPEIRDRIRDGLSIPRDAFLVGMVAANKSPASQDRKSWAKALHAFAIFAQQHPDAYMYAHTEPKPFGGNGSDLDDLATIVGIPPGRLRFPPDKGWALGMPRELVATVYQAFDVLLNPSKGEGFGIPLIEAQACGVPVITSNHSAMPELTHAGWTVEGDPWWDEVQKSFFFDPFIESIRDALERAHEARGDGELRQAAVRFAQRYDADTVTEKHWKPTLEALRAPRTASQPSDRLTGRAERRRAERAARKTPKKGVTAHG